MDQAYKALLSDVLKQSQVEHEVQKGYVLRRVQSISTKTDCLPLQTTWLPAPSLSEKNRAAADEYSEFRDGSAFLSALASCETSAGVDKAIDQFEDASKSWAKQSLVQESKLKEITVQLRDYLEELKSLTPALKALGDADFEKKKTSIQSKLSRELAGATPSGPVDLLQFQSMAKLLVSMNAFFKDNEANIARANSALKEVELKKLVEATAKREAEEEIKRAAAAKAKREAEKKAKRAAEATAKREAEAKAKREAEEKAEKAAEAKAKREAEAKAKKAAEAKTKREAEAKAKKAAEAKTKREAEAKRQAEEKPWSVFVELTTIRDQLGWLTKGIGSASFQTESGKLKGQLARAIEASEALGIGNKKMFDMGAISDLAVRQKTATRISQNDVLLIEAQLFMQTHSVLDKIKKAAEAEAKREADEKAKKAAEAAVEKAAEAKAKQEAEEKSRHRLTRLRNGYGGWAPMIIGLAILCDLGIFYHLSYHRGFEDDLVGMVGISLICATIHTLPLLVNSYNGLFAMVIAIGFPLFLVGFTDPYLTNDIEKMNEMGMMVAATILLGFAYPIAAFLSGRKK